MKREAYPGYVLTDSQISTLLHSYLTMSHPLQPKPIEGIAFQELGNRLDTEKLSASTAYDYASSLFDFFTSNLYRNSNVYRDRIDTELNKTDTLSNPNLTFGTYLWGDNRTYLCNIQVIPNQRLSITFSHLPSSNEGEVVEELVLDRTGLGTPISYSKDGISQANTIGAVRHGEKLLARLSSLLSESHEHEGLISKNDYFLTASRLVRMENRGVLTPEQERVSNFEIFMLYYYLNKNYPEGSNNSPIDPEGEQRVLRKAKRFLEIVQAITREPELVEMNKNAQVPWVTWGAELEIFGGRKKDIGTRDYRLSQLNLTGVFTSDAQPELRTMPSYGVLSLFELRALVKLGFLDRTTVAPHTTIAGVKVGPHNPEVMQLTAIAFTLGMIYEPITAFVADGILESQGSPRYYMSQEKHQKSYKGEDDIEYYSARHKLRTPEYIKPYGRRFTSAVELRPYSPLEFPWLAALQKNYYLYTRVCRVLQAVQKPQGQKSQLETRLSECWRSTEKTSQPGLLDEWEKIIQEGGVSPLPTERYTMATKGAVLVDGKYLSEYDNFVTQLIALARLREDVRRDMQESVARFMKKVSALLPDEKSFLPEVPELSEIAA